MSQERPRSRQQHAIHDVVDNNNLLVYWYSPSNSPVVDTIQFAFGANALPNLLSRIFHPRHFLMSVLPVGHLMAGYIYFIALKPTIEYWAWNFSSNLVDCYDYSVTVIVKAYDSSSCYFLCLLDNCSSVWQVIAQSDSKFENSLYPTFLNLCQFSTFSRIPTSRWQSDQTLCYRFHVCIGHPTGLFDLPESLI